MQPEVSAVTTAKDPRAKLDTIEAGLNERFLGLKKEVLRIDRSFARRHRRRC